MSIALPAPAAIRRAVEIFIEHAHGDRPPPYALKFLPPREDFDVAAWLMSNLSERTPEGASLSRVRSFALRIGSSHYRHLKLRLSRPGKKPFFVFTVDSHDTFLQAEPGSPDYEGLQELKRANAAVATKITLAWEAAGLQTEKNHLRRAISTARSRQEKPKAP